MSSLIAYVYTTIAMLAVFAVYNGRRERARNPHRLPYPPGPTGYPLIGNFFTIPRKKHWFGFKELSRTYGDLTFVKSLRVNYLILDSIERINDILDKHSATYSDRGKTVMLLDLMKWDFNFAFIPYTTWWKRQRKLFHDYFSPIIIEKYDELQRKEVHGFLYRILQNPEEFQNHIPLTFAAISMKIVYGIDIHDGESTRKNSVNSYVSVVREAFSEGLAVSGIPGMHLVDHFPILKWVPAWFPGAEFQNVARKAREVVEKMTVIKTVNRVKQAMLEGNSPPSMVAEQLSNIPPDSDFDTKKEEELLITHVAGVSYAAGADTTASSLSAFFLAMAKFPAAQKKAQEEIDSITGGTRLPDFGDRSSMPYMEAVLLELMRWHPVAPLAVPHMSMEDDEYDGYFIPKGTIVIPNVWSVLNNPDIYPDPSTFDPDRFIKNPDLLSPHAAFWGFGRRICPGRFFSNRNVFAVISSLLAVFDILPPIDENGNPIPLHYGATTGIVSIERMNDILDKHSANYSDRGKTVMLLDLMKWDFNFGFIPYTAWWKRQRKLFHDYFSPIIIERYDELQRKEVQGFLYRILQTPEEFQNHIPLTFAAISMKIVYGIDIHDGESTNSVNSYVAVVREAFSEGLAVSGIPGMHLVDHFPILKWVPAWFPGAEFQNVARKAREVVEKMTVIKTVNRVKQAMLEGSAPPSMVAEQLSNIPPDSDDNTRKEGELLITHVAGVSYAAGADTTASSLSAFFLAMAMFPAAQKKAQAEIDSITSGNRLPDFRDRPSMPYTEAVLLELMRWHPVTPLAVPHMSMEDDEYDGYFIPKGTIVIPNVWSVFNNPDIFPDPSTFDPDRYIKNPDLLSPHAAFFGFGRRICPGRFFSNRNVFAVISSVLAAFDILPPIDEKGNPIGLHYEATTGIVSYPKDFTCRIVPRSDAAKKLVLEAYLQSHT
ncbi:hypothetical protein CVT24_001803 [Panaeolus cyanescens]|uniref:Cytochrome P450 n=1 Tax=Panaeolus cyanescens TaxID=181874 RepID=A0A409YFJ4_9AGAR|nr:hypothetical protein CVT24_001803 [Panaeolus cyanescens]